MKFTLSWLKKYLLTNYSAQEIGDALTSIGLEVEDIIDKGKLYEPFIISKIIAAGPHPNADKLRVCKVDNGEEILQVVCGASNAREGIKVVLAPIGTVIPSNDLLIKASTIRGVESSGMLCTFEELSMKFTEAEAQGIIELPENAEVGARYSEYANLNDILFDISITPNRGDALSVYGIARDLAALGIGELTEINFKKREHSSQKLPFNLSIDDKENCQEFTLTYIENVDNTLAVPKVIKQLEAIGSSSKSAIVDISNYTMYELGRPNHCYDADKIEGNIIVRKSRDQEKFIALGNLDLILPEGLLVVADDQKILALAGIIGGELSKVEEATKNIVVEVANFNPIAVTRAGRKLNIITDSRYRFERKVDSGNTELSRNYLVNMIAENCGGKVTGEQSLKGNSLNYLNEIKFDFARIKQVSGHDIEYKKIVEILNRLGFKVEGSNIIIPSWRYGDIENDVDVIEEVLRIYGFHNIPSISLPIETKTVQIKFKNFINDSRVLLSNRNFYEIISWSFVSEKIASIFGFKDSLELANPISIDMTIMRQTLLPGLLLAAQNNIARGFVNYNYFEIGNVYNINAPLNQEMNIGGLRVGKFQPKTIFNNERAFDFFDVKADIFAVIEEYGFDTEKLIIEKGTPEYYHPGRAMKLMVGKQVVGFAGELHPNILKHFDIDSAVAFELFVNKLPQLKIKTVKAKLNLSNYQSVNRDFAFILDDEIIAGDLVRVIKKLDSNLIKNVSVFDCYQGDKIEKGKKSIALSVVLRSQNETLKDEQIENISSKIVDEISNKFNGKQR